MKSFYELYRDSDSALAVTKRSDYSFPPHFHAALEILILLRGKYKISIDSKTFVAEGKSVIVADSFNIHSFYKLTEEPSETMLMIIPPVYLNEFNKIKNGKILLSNLCKNEQTVDEICSLLNFMNAHESPLMKKAYVNAILSLLTEELGLTESTEEKNLLTIKNVLQYVHEHFKEDLSLESIAAHFGYSPCHLSRLFHSYFQMSISRYVNNQRIEWIENAQKSDNETMTSLIYEAGFKSPQTYYRNLKTYRGQTN